MTSQDEKREREDDRMRRTEELRQWVERRRCPNDVFELGDPSNHARHHAYVSKWHDTMLGTCRMGTVRGHHLGDRVRLLDPALRSLRCAFRRT